MSSEESNSECESPKTGRPKVHIDWEEVNSLLMAKCSGSEIAGEIGIHKETFYRKCQEEHGIPFSEYCLQFYAKGDAKLRAQQYAKALGFTDKGDNTLLIWLGKIRLGQKEKDESSVRVEIVHANATSDGSV